MVKYHFTQTLHYVSCYLLNTIDKEYIDDEAGKWCEVLGGCKFAKSTGYVSFLLRYPFISPPWPLAPDAPLFRSVESLNDRIQ